MTLLKFLKDRLDEDEDKAKAAVDRKAGYVEGWAEFDGDAGGFLGPFGTFLPVKYTVSDCDTPTRVLREVAAKRAVINMVPLSQEEAEERFAGFDVEEGAGWEKAQEYVLKHLAAVYSGHPDYRQEWADA